MRTSKNLIHSPEEWVDDYLSSHGISYDYKTDGYKQESLVIEPKILMAKLRPRPIKMATRIPTSPSGFSNAMEI